MNAMASIISLPAELYVDARYYFIIMNSTEDDFLRWRYARTFTLIGFTALEVLIDAQPGTNISYSFRAKWEEYLKVKNMYDSKGLLWNNLENLKKSRKSIVHYKPGCDLFEIYKKLVNDASQNLRTIRDLFVIVHSENAIMSWEKKWNV
jgi:hypothetical protein